MRRTLTGMVAALLALPLSAQGMAGMAGMTMPMPAAKPRAKPPARAAHAPRTGGPATHGAAHDTPPAEAPATTHDMADMPGMAMPPVQPAAPAGADRSGTALPAGETPAPPAPRDYYADATYGRAAMERARARMAFEQGGQPFHQILFNLAEYQARDGRNGYRWDGEAWFGGDIDRLALRTEGEGTMQAGLDAAEVQFLYAHAIGPYFTLQGGIRQDIRPTPARTYASLGVEGLAPYEFETEARLFVSTHGEVLARLEAWYDQHVTQRLILQPRVELNLAARSSQTIDVGKGLTDAELGVRLRYEISRKLAPYVGISYTAETGRTADYARAARRDPTTTSYVAGMRVWF